MEVKARISVNSTVCIARRPVRLLNADSSGSRHWLTAHLVPRLWLNPRLHVGDASHFQLLLGERFAMLHPEAVAADLRASFAA